ncbi:MAG: hypothetical protein ACYTKD_27925, partial [Planctomycetota bacterium]
VLLTLAFLRMMRGEANVTESQANTTDRAIGIKRVKVDVRVEGYYFSGPRCISRSSATSLR